MRYYIFEDETGGTVAVLASSVDAARHAFNLSESKYDYIHDFPVSELERYA